MFTPLEVNSVCIGKTDDGYESQFQVWSCGIAHGQVSQTVSNKLIALGQPPQSHVADP